MIHLVYPELQFSSPGLDRLSELERQGPISRLGLSVRAQNILQWRKVNTIGELVEVIRSEVGIAIKRNFGPKTHENLVHSILALSEAATPEGGVDWQKYGELAKKKFCGMRVREAVRYVGLDKIMKPEIKHNGWPGPFGEITEAVSKQTLETLPFSNRAIQGLKAMGVMTIGDATRICAPDLLKVRNVGRNTIQEIYGTIRMAVSSETEVHIVTDSVDVVMSQFPFVPVRSKGLPEQFYLDFFSELPAVIKKYEGSEEEIILCSRLFCSSENRKTLDVVGKRIGKTRERVRQEETDLILKLKASLFDGKYTYNKIGKNKNLAFGKVRFRVQPEFQELCKNLPERVRGESPPLVEVSVWTKILANILQMPVAAIEQYLPFWMEALAYKKAPENRVKHVSLSPTPRMSAVGE